MYLRNGRSGRIVIKRAFTLAVVTAAWALAPLVAGAAGDDPTPPDYTPDPASLRQHQVPKWFEDAKLGYFIHWGAYSVPAYAPPSGGTPYAEWYWNELNRPGSPTYERHRALYGEDFPYDRFIEQWRAEKFDPDAWLRLFQQGGAKYFVQVSKHHDGVALFDTATTDRSTVELGPHRDFVKELFDAADRGHYGLKRGLYYSLPEWFHPNNSAFGGTFGQGPPHNPFTGAEIPYTGYKPIADYVDDHQYPQMLELIDQYDPDILWCDIGGPNRSNEVFAHYFNQAKNRPQPKEVTVDNRCGNGIYDFTTPEYSVEPDINPAKWEATRGIGRSFGFNAQEGPADYLSENELVDSFVDIVSKNGNLLLNVGPRADGTIAPIQAERVRALGSWLRINGAAIYGTTYWTHAEDDASNVPVRYTAKGGTLYATAQAWPGSTLTLSGDLPVKAGSTITLLGSNARPLSWRRTGDTVSVTMPAAGAKATESRNAFTFKIATPGVDQLVRTRVEVPPAADIGETFTAKVTATNLADSATPAGQVTLDAPAGWTVEPASTAAAPLAAHETRTFEFRVTAGAGTEPGRYTLASRSTFGAMSFTATSGSIRVGLENAALGKTATQKSLAWGGTPDRAVDGDVNGTYFDGSVTHTAEDGSAEPWWQVDLAADVAIREIAVWNRTDCCSERLSDYYVLVSDQPFTSDSLSETLAQPGVTAFHEQGTAGRPSSFAVNRSGRYVRVQLKGNAPLSLAEVEVLTAGGG
jgi:alpha-L-fucosidase